MQFCLCTSTKQQIQCILRSDARIIVFLASSPRLLRAAGALYTRNLQVSSRVVTQPARSCQNIAGRIGSGQEVLKISRVESGHPIRPARSDPTPEKPGDWVLSTLPSEESYTSQLTPPHRHNNTTADCHGSRTNYRSGSVLTLVEPRNS